jgi:putative ABC transport system permease protein
MNTRRLILQSLSHYRWTSAGVLLSAALGTAVLTGALLVGDCVRYGLTHRVELRLGRVQTALIGGDRFFRQLLADDLAQRLVMDAAPVIVLPAVAINPDTDRRVNSVQLVGIDDRFFRLGPTKKIPPLIGSDSVILNEALARRLEIQPGGEIVLRVAKPGLLPRDVALAGPDESSIAFRSTVETIASAEQFGDFNLFANQAAPLNVFVPLSVIADKIGQTGKANILLCTVPNRDGSVEAALAESIGIEDLGLELRTLANGQIELRSPRVFLEPPIAAAALSAGKDASPALTYFVNDLRIADRTTPYSMVTAVSPENYPGLFPAETRDNPIVLNQWLADDLGTKVGDLLTMQYYLVDDARRIVIAASAFTVCGIIPMDHPALDRDRMPEFPGLADSQNCRDWKPGVPVNLDRIRDKDEKYWDDYRGTPKALIPLATGQSIWQNRFGNLTAVRWPAAGNSIEDLAAAIRKSVKPSAIGLTVQPIREQADAASAGTSSFGGLFLGLSMFLIASAIVLIALIFAFGLQQRLSQAGLLIAVGWPAPQVRRVLLAEAAILCVAGAALGSLAALGYTAVMIFALESVWSGAIAGATLWFHPTLRSVLIGGGISVVIGLAACTMTLRKPLRRPARELLAGPSESMTSNPIPGRVSAWIGNTCVLILFGLLFLFIFSNSFPSSPGLFFVIGSLLLSASLSFAHRWLAWVHNQRTSLSQLSQLARRNTTRRKGRSLAVILLLAVGVFLVVAVGANRQNPLATAHLRSSGTGGFALFAQSAIDLPKDPGTDEGHQFFNLDAASMKDVGIVPMRIREGDDASCLNLNRAQQPRIYGVDPKRLSDLGAFSFKGLSAIWLSLEDDLGSDCIPAVGDYATVYWALGKRLGDEIAFTDDKGNPVRLRIVGMLNNSILQGGLVISEANFIRRFPSVGGYKAFLIDAPADRQTAMADALSRSLRDYGLEVVPAVDRLAMFAAVENTYLSIFALLGGLGLVIGTIGLGFVVWVNVLQRSGELAMMRAVGFARPRLHALLIGEHILLVLLGVAIGALCGLVAVLPAILSAGSQLPIVGLALMIVIIAACGLLWVRLAATAALRGNLLDALRNE